MDHRAEALATTIVETPRALRNDESNGQAGGFGMGSVSHRICRARVPYRVICHAEYGEQSAVSAKAHESPEFTPEFLRFAMWSRDAHVEDATEATLGGDGGATRDKDAACRQASSAALMRSNKGGALSVS